MSATVLSNDPAGMALWAEFALLPRQQRIARQGEFEERARISNAARPFRRILEGVQDATVYASRITGCLL